MSIDITYTFVAMTIARASEVNQNFTDLRDSIRGAHHQDADGTKLVNADLDASAAVVYSKLSLSNSIVNADINTSAAIAWTKISKSGSVFNDLGDVVITGAASQDILHRNGSSQWVNLVKGSDGDVLSMVGGLLTWQAPSFAHNDASGLQGGTTAQYYHLTSAEYSDLADLTNGSDMTGSHRHGKKVGTFTSPGSTGTYAVSGLGFRPSLVEFRISHSGGGGSLSWTSITEGAATSSSNRWTTSQVSGYDNRVHYNATSTSYCIMYARESGGGSILHIRADFVSMDADGFTLNFDTVTDTRSVYWKAFE